MRVVICGAGIAGLTLASRLVLQGHHVVLLERAPGPRPQGYMIDFFGPGYDTVDAMGLMPAVEQVAYHIDEATLVDERGRRRAGIDPAQFAVGHPPQEEIYYDQVAQAVLPTWSKGRVVLIGDAAYAVSLLAGQGASLGVAGAWLLADQLARTESIGAALAAYERRWRPVVEEKQQVARSAARWFLPRSTPELLLRRLMLRFVRLPLVNRSAAAAIAGKSTALIDNLSQDPPTLAGPGVTRSEQRKAEGR